MTLSPETATWGLQIRNLPCSCESAADAYEGRDNATLELVRQPMPRSLPPPRKQTFELAQALQKGITSLKEGKHGEAEQFFKAILKSVPAHPDARHFLGVLRFQQGRSDEALELMNGVLRHHPKSPYLLSNLGLVLHALGRFEESLQRLDQSLALESGQPEALYNRGNALRALGRFDDALESYSQALAAKPGYAEALNGRATLFMEQGKWSDVESCLRECVQLAPGYAEAQVNLGLVLVQVGRDAEAAAQVEMARTLQAQKDFPHHSFGLLLARCGQVKEAQEQLRMALARDPQDAQGARLLLAGLGGQPLPERLSVTFVNRLYAKRALEWDRLMTEGNYRGAHLVVEALTRFAPQDRQLEILDAGCGTGLVGELLRGSARSLVGVDLSNEMLARAATKGAYSSLHRDDLVEFLTAHPASYDAVTCAATLIHFGDLQPVFGAAGNALRAGGLFVFTLFNNKTETSGYTAGTLSDGYAQGGCYAHGAGYVDATARSARFEILFLQEAIHEHNFGVAKAGLIVVLQKLQPR